jgi:hypothetical protein
MILSVRKLIFCPQWNIIADQDHSETPVILLEVKGPLWVDPSQGIESASLAFLF